MRNGQKLSERIASRFENGYGDEGLLAKVLTPIVVTVAVVGLCVCALVALPFASVAALWQKLTGNRTKSASVNPAEPKS